MEMGKVVSYITSDNGREITGAIAPKIPRVDQLACPTLQQAAAAAVRNYSAEEFGRGLLIISQQAPPPSSKPPRPENTVSKNNTNIQVDPAFCT
jgi:hypothetical protein